MVTRAVRAYFALSYYLLLGSAVGRRFLALAAADGLPEVHGYLTADDLDTLIHSLRPTSEQRLLDLGCGIGGLALEVHRRSGARILGVDLSPRAVAEARRRAARAGVGQAVSFVVGDFARPPRVGATGAYAIDSLMFASDLAASVRGITGSIASGGRLFATALVMGPEAPARLAAALAAAEAVVERVDDVTPALLVSSARRARAARALLRVPSGTIRGRLAMVLVIGEEALVAWVGGRGRLRRVRFVVRTVSGTDRRDARHSASCPADASSLQTR